MEAIHVRNWILIAGAILLAGWAIFDFVANQQSKDEMIAEGFQDEVSKGEWEEQTGTGKQVKQLNIEKGDNAPDFELVTTEDETVHLSDFAGKKVLLNFWATWCPPCRNEMPDMQTYHETTDDAVILAVNITESERKVADVDDFLDEFGITFDVLLDEETSVANLYTAHAMPTSYFIDSDGIIQEKVMGEINLDFIEKQFKEMD